MALPIDISRAARSLAARRALIEAVRDAPASEQETHWLEWKGQLDLTARATHAVLAKAVLGFANRDPDRAQLTMGGTAYLLVGVAPDTFPGVQPVDMARLEPQVVRYAGTGPQWSGDYVEVDGKTVLVLVVDAPEWGQDPWPAQKTFQPNLGKGFDAGDLFVRQAARTEKAGPADIEILTRRARGKTQEDDRLQLDLVQDPGPGPGRVDLSDLTIGQYTNKQRGQLLTPMWRREHEEQGVSSLVTFRVGPREDRRREDFEAEVGKYIDELREALPPYLSMRSVLHKVGALDLQVVNPTDRPFTEVQVRLRFDTLDVEVIADRDDASYSAPELPEPPREWGSPTFYRDPYRGLAIGPIRVFNKWTPDVHRKGKDHLEVVFVPEVVRPHQTTELPRIWLVASADGPTQLEVTWTATGTEARGQASGSLTIRLDGRTWTPEELLADPEDDD